ncbi:hypothetical protein DID80_01355 [Candidatus Marinamargulisbacteria bacterium SCGC AAA071-K20]|nr:hypothetical protein DID80_01355 [Candidatus Marinamargulisbacteria bacterium SCGC AAA071-K20]
MFELRQDLIGPVDTVFDRGALVALPQSIRLDYAKHIIDITKSALYPTSSPFGTSVYHSIKFTVPQLAWS